MRLRTERLLVRDLAPSDVDAVHALLDVDLRLDHRSHAGRAQWLDWTMADHEQRALAHQPPPYGDYAVEHVDSGELVGLVGLVASLMPFGLFPGYRLGGIDARFAVPEVGLFWAVATAHQRRGYASEAAAAVIAFGFDDLQLARMVATTEASNAASTAVLRRVGMRVERNPRPEPFYMQVVA